MEEFNSFLKTYSNDNNSNTQFDKYFSLFSPFYLLVGSILKFLTMPTIRIFLHRYALTEEPLPYTSLSWWIVKNTFPTCTINSWIIKVYSSLFSLLFRYNPSSSRGSQEGLLSHQYDLFQILCFPSSSFDCKQRYSFFHSTLR